MIGWMRDNIADQGMALYIISFVIFLGSLVVLAVPASQVNRSDEKAATKQALKKNAVAS